jgi:hypothetical protein
MVSGGAPQVHGSPVVRRLDGRDPMSIAPQYGSHVRLVFQECFHLSGTGSKRLQFGHRSVELFLRNGLGEGLVIPRWISPKRPILDADSAQPFRFFATNELEGKPDRGADITNPT